MPNPFGDWLRRQGLDGQTVVLLTTVIQVVLVLVAAAIADLVAKRVVVRGLETFFSRTASVWDDIIVKRRLLHRLSHLAPALVIYLFAGPVLEGYDLSILIVRRIALIFMIVVTLLAIDSVLDAMVDILRSSVFARDLPVKSVIQVLKVILYGIAVIAVVSLIIGQSPSLLLGGLGAMTAVLMLVFKDPILGLVAGIQLSTNQMLARGDWIEMPKYGADGDVLEVALTTVKVQNWDKTITTIPTYALITGVVQKLARYVQVRGAADQTCHQHQYELDSLLRPGDARSVLEDPVHHPVPGEEATGDRKLEYRAPCRPIGPGQRSPPDERGHIQSLCCRLSAQPPDDSSRDDIPRAAARADRTRPTDRNLCVQSRPGVEQL